jgi:hypothetical protein
VPSLTEDLSGFFKYWVLGLIQVVVGLLGMFAMMYLVMFREIFGNFANMPTVLELIFSALIIAPLALSFLGIRRILSAFRDVR